MNWSRLFFGIIILLSPWVFAEVDLDQTGWKNRLSVYKSRSPYEHLDVQSIQAWDSYEQVLKYFLLIRDTRFIQDPQVKGALRRISWMFPDFCCNARALLAIEFLRKFKDLPLPNKLFIFGDRHRYDNFSIESEFSQYGGVAWVDHVALTVRVGAQVYVLDPSVEITRPLKLDEWISALTHDKSNVSLSACHPDAFEPRSPCHEPRGELETALKHQNKCLKLERKRVKILGLDPNAVLFDYPPWTKRFEAD